MYLKRIYWNFFKKNNFSQGEEELFLLNYFKKVNDGFYIDVGCYSPKKFSNTYALYKKGWSGINIDPNENTIKEFDKFRTRDKNILAFVSSKIKSYKYFYFDEPALNGFLTKKRLKILKDEGFRLKKTKNIHSKTLNQILTECGSIRKIDLLDIDVEGLDYDVLKSIDLDNIYVGLILVEVNISNKKRIKNYLIEKEYENIAKIDRNYIFRKKN